MVNEELIERLEAEATVSDAEPEELTVAVESEVEETQERVEELQAEVDEKETKVEELQSEVDEKESEVAELQDEIETVEEFYAEELAKTSPLMDEDDWMQRYEVSELREKFEEYQEEAEPNPESGDPGANVQTTEEGDPGEGDVPEEEELSEDERVAAEAFEERAKTTGKSYWQDIAEDIAGE